MQQDALIHLVGPKGHDSTLCVLLGYIDLRVFLPLTISPSDSIPPSLGDIHTEPDDQTGSEAKGKEEGEPIPIVSRAVDDCLDDVRADHARCPVREAKQAEELTAQLRVTSVGPGLCEVHSPYCQTREDSARPSSSGRRRSRGPGTARIRRYMPCILAFVRRCITHTQHRSPTNQNSQAL